MAEIIPLHSAACATAAPVPSLLSTLRQLAGAASARRELRSLSPRLLKDAGIDAATLGMTTDRLRSEMRAGLCW